jgi:hypothetical protein
MKSKSAYQAILYQLLSHNKNLIHIVHKNLIRKKASCTCIVFCLSVYVRQKLDIPPQKCKSHASCTMTSTLPAYFSFSWLTTTLEESKLNTLTSPRPSLRISYKKINHIIAQTQQYLQGITLSFRIQVLKQSTLPLYLSKGAGMV